MSDGLKVALVTALTLPLTLLFLSWFTVLPAIGLLWLAGWLK